MASHATDRNPMSGNNNRQQSNQTQEKKKFIVDLTRFLDKGVRVKFQGGREVNGTLKGFDALLNLVLDDTVEFLRDPEDSNKLTEETRKLGLVVCRGPTVVVIGPLDGMEQIANPFLQQE